MTGPAIPSVTLPSAQDTRYTWKSLLNKPVIPAAAAAPAAGSPPTKAEFDALVADVAAIRAALNA